MVASGSKYKVARRRRREGKTDYRKRYIYVLSKKTRLVIRKTNKYIDVKLVDLNPKGDITRVSAHSIELIKKYGWKGSGKSLPAAYLTGYLLAKRAIKNGITKAVVDIGLHRPVRGSRIFAVVKGAIDGGLEVPASEEIFPDEERIKGAHISKYAEELKAKAPEKFQRQFSLMLAKGFDPVGYVSHFQEVLDKINKDFEAR